LLYATPNCNSNGTLLALYTGQTTPPPFQYFGNSLKLEFSVSSPGFQEGFSLQYQAETECPAGYFLSNGMECSPCTAGTYSSGGLASSCTPCDAGTYSGAMAPICTSCDIGTYQPLPGKSSCLLCGTGAFANTTGSSTCASCNAGMVRVLEHDHTNSASTHQ
jgi:hypothetical protein